MLWYKIIPLINPKFAEFHSGFSRLEGERYEWVSWFGKNVIELLFMDYLWRIDF